MSVAETPPTAKARPEPPAKIRCDACPVLCFIAEGRTGACDRYANHAGNLVRLDPLTVIELGDNDQRLVPFLGARTTIEAGADEDGVGAAAAPDSPQNVAKLHPETDEPAPAEDAWEGAPFSAGGVVASGDKGVKPRSFVTAIGAGTTYPDYKPAPFIVSQTVGEEDMVTVVTEGIFSYCGVKVKIDTDRHIGEERAVVRVDGEPVGHVTTGEYGSRMLALGGVDHLTGGSKKEGRVTCSTLLALCNRESVDMTIDEGAELTIAAGKAPIINGVEEARMRVGCGSATIGMFARQWAPHVDEVVVVDDHITGVLSEHQAGRLLDVPPTGIKVNGRKSTPGRYFQVADPGTSWGGTNIEDPLSILAPFNPKVAWPGLRLLMVSTTGEQWGYFTLNEALEPEPADLTAPLMKVVDRIAENCEPAMASVLFMGGAGGSLRAGVTENPVALTRSVKAAITKVTCGGAPAYVWPGGGITVMADVLDMPQNSFGYVPTPALVAPIEFTLREADYRALGGYVSEVQTLPEVLSKAKREGLRTVSEAA